MIHVLFFGGRMAEEVFDEESDELRGAVIQ